MGQVHVIKRRDAAATRASILAAARQRFVNESYDSVGLRDIAGDAGVDVALIGRYFGGKAGLFLEVLRPGDKSPLDASMRAADLPRHLSQMMAEANSESPNHRMEMFIIMLRSASSPKAGEIIREHMRNDVLQPLIAVIGAESAEWRANILLSLFLGIGVLRTVMESDGLACEEQDRAAFTDRLERLFAAVLEI